MERFYRKGIGFRLMNKAEKEVLENGYKKFNLEVYVYNARAIAFYKRQGYKSIGTADFSMESNTYKSLVMK